MEKHYAIFKQKKIRTIYETTNEIKYDSYNCQSRRTGRLVLKETSELIEDVLIWEGEIPNPQLTKNEQIYIEELSIVVTVGYGLRTTSDKMFYYLQANEIIEDEKTFKSKEEALRKIEEHNINFEEKESTTKSQQKKWYQFWK